jgi:TolA-binding protein
LSPSVRLPPDLAGTDRVGLGLDRLGITQAISGLVLGLIALYGLRPTTSTPPMTTFHSAATGSPSSSNGESFASLPRWRQFLSMLNWRRDPDFERRIHALRSDRERIEKNILQVEKEIEQIKNETEQIERETEQLRRENARLRALNALTRQLCFPPESSSIPIPPTESDSRSS